MAYSKITPTVYKFNKSLINFTIKIIITPITMRISQELGFTVVGFYNAYCEEECDEENELIEQFSGMKNIKGSVVLCGFDNVYTPLKEYQVERLLDYLRTKY